METTRQVSPPVQQSTSLRWGFIPLTFFRPLVLITIGWPLFVYGDASAPLWLNVGVVGVDIATLAILAATLKKEGRSLRSLLAFRASDIGWGLLSGVILAVTYFMAVFAGNLIVYGGAPPMSTATITVPLWLGLWCTLVLPVTTGLAEESLYRGYLQPAWQKHLGKAAGLIVVAVVFGLQHLAFAWTTPQAALSRVIALSLVGIVLGLLYTWLRRVMPLAIGHWLLNTVFLGLPLLYAALAA